MALARVCDRCGKTATKYFYGISVEKYSFKKIGHKDCINGSDRRCYELCPECMDTFKIFIQLDKEE